MTTRFLSFIFCTFFCFPLCSKNIVQNDSLIFPFTELGLRAGFNISSFPSKIQIDGVLRSEKIEEQTPLLRGYMGFLASYRYNLHFAAQTGLDISWQGGEVNNQKIRFTQLQIPILAKIYAVKGLNFLVGPYGSLAISRRIVENNTKISASEMFNLWNVGFQGGICYEFKIGLFAEFRYMRDFVNNYKDIYDGFSLSGQNQLFQLGIGYNFKL